MAHIPNSPALDPKLVAEEERSRKKIWNRILILTRDPKIFEMAREHFKDPNEKPLQAQPAHSHGVLSRSSLEAYVAIALALIQGAIPMTWWLRCLFIVGLMGICCDVVCRSQWTVSFQGKRKFGICVLCVIFIAALTARPIYEDYKRGAFDPEPQFTFSLDDQKDVLTLDNTRAKSDITNIRIQGIAYHLSLPNYNIFQRTQIGTFNGNLLWNSLTVKAGKRITIDLTDARVIDPLVSFDDIFGPPPSYTPDSDKMALMFSNYYCLRLLFINQGTGKEYVHYMIVGMYKHSHNGCVSPEKWSATGTRKDLAIAACDEMKANAREWYGTALKEYDGP